MRLHALFFIVPALVLSACSSDKSSDKLNADLALASQNAARMDSISAVERSRAQAASAPAAAAQAPVRSSSAPRRATSGASSSTGTSASATPRTVEVKHGGRDAAIGAAAGAIIGATTSRDKVKGGLIGAAAGGILGGVVGNNVDKQTKPAP
ncbi:MAG: glycine zipper domain-containing protein [bacterium]